MKILMVTTHLEMGGIPVYVVNLARGLKDKGHLPILASSGGWFESILKKEGIRHVKIPSQTSSELNPSLWFSAFPRLLRLVRKERPDLLHAHTRVAQLLSWAVSSFTGIPFVTTCHGLYQYRLGRRIFHCWGKWVMAVSASTREELLKHDRSISPHQVILIRNGIEMARFLERADQEKVRQYKEAIGLRGAPIVGAIARLSPVKGLDTLIRVLPRLVPQFPRLQLLLVGSGPAKSDLVRLAYSLGVAEHVVMTPSVEDTRIPLAAMQLFLAPSHQEGFGLAIVEAMAAGVAVVATRNGGPSEIIQDGKSGLLVPPGDPEPWEEAIRTLLNDSALREKFQETARQRAQEEFDMKRVVEEVEDVYAKTVA